MPYTNSLLISETKLSPYHSNRARKIDRITIHCFAAQCSLSSGLNAFQNRPNDFASCNYVIATDGRIGLVVEESQKSNCSSNSANDHRAITIEVASDHEYPYTMNDKAFNSLLNLVEDICRRNGIRKLLWIENKIEALAYNPADGEAVLTLHKWFTNKACPGAFCIGKMPFISEEITKRIERGYVDMTIDEFINSLTPEQANAIYTKAVQYMNDQPLPTTWDAEGELKEAVDMGITTETGETANMPCPRYQTAIMIKRAMKGGMNK